MRPTRKRRTDPLALWMPAYGMVEGGRLHGYRYTFVRFVVTGGSLLIEASVTPPNWPFPRNAMLCPLDYDTLYAVPGERARRIRADALIAEAASHQQQQPKDEGEPKLTGTGRVVAAGPAWY